MVPKPILPSRHRRGAPFHHQIARCQRVARRGIYQQRVRILDALSHAEVPVCDLAELLDLTQSAVSHQLRLLRGARLVKSRRDGQHIYYTLDDQHIVKLFEQGLEHVQERDSALRARRA